MVTAIWTRDESNYENFPGEFSGSVVPTKDKKIGHFCVENHKTGHILFGMNVILPKGEKAEKKFSDHMDDLMNGVIELKSNRHD